MIDGNARDLFLKQIRENAGIIQKVVAIYTDTREDGEDLFQEILYQSWKAFSTFRQESKFSTWLYRVSLNTALVFRRNAKQRETQGIDDTTVQPAVEPKFANQETESLLRAIKSMQKIDRMIITLHLEGYSNAEIAETIGITKENTAVKIHRIKKTLAEKLTSYEKH